MKSDQIKLIKYKLQLKFPWIAGPLAAVPVLALPRPELLRLFRLPQTYTDIGIIFDASNLHLYIAEELNDRYKLYQNFGIVGYLILKEAMSITVGYPLRGIKKHQFLWHLASEIKLTQFLEELEWETPPEYKKFRINSFDEWSAEQVYYYLLKNAELEPNSNFNKNRQQQESGTHKSNNSHSCKRNKSAPNDKGGPNIGDGSDVDTPPDNDANFDFKVKFKDPDGKLRELNMSITYRNMPKSDKDISEELKDMHNIARDMERRLRNQGLAPAGFLREINVALRRGKINWLDTVFHYLLSKFQIHQVTYVPPSRRLLANDIYLPSVNYVNKKFKVWVMLDTSGSIGDDELKEFAIELISLLKTVSILSLKITYVDADVQGEIKVEDAEEFLKNYKPKGGGGTNFVPFFKHVENQIDKDTYDVFIAFTDGYATYPNKFSMSDQTYWFIIDKGGNKPPFGNVIYLNS